MEWTRKNIAGKLKLDKYEIDVVSMEVGGARRIAKYNAVQADGAETEDLGEDAREVIVSCIITEDLYQKLDTLMIQAKPISYQGPVFGVGMVRITKVKGTLNQKEMMDVTIDLVFDGIIQKRAASTTTGQGATSAANKYKKKSDLFSDSLDGL